MNPKGGGHRIHLSSGTAMGSHFVRWGCFSRRNRLSRWQFITILKSVMKFLTVWIGLTSNLELSKEMNACTRYLLPPHRSLVDLDDVPEEKSSLSMHATLSPLRAASSAAPLPVAPPPMINKSSSEAFSLNSFMLASLPAAAVGRFLAEE